jgi:uncharacterized protein
MERSGATELNCSFFGGEPLLNWDLIVHITKKLRTEYPNLVKSLVIISNMTMIDQEKVDFIKKWGLGVSWSFDGMSSNDTRPLLPMLENKNKDGEMYNGILELYQDKMHLIRQVSNGCKVMIWPGNTTQMTENYKFFLSEGITSPDFTIVRDDVWTRDDLIEFKRSVTELADEYIKTVKDGVYSSIGFFNIHIIDAIFGHTYGKRDFACFAGTHGAVLMPNGDFYPCARFASKKLMKVDDDFSFEYWQDKLNPQKFDKCQSCDMYQVCNTGCTYSQVQNGNKPLDSVCELFHMIEEQSLRIVHELKDNDLFRDILIRSIGNIG